MKTHLLTSIGRENHARGRQEGKEGLIERQLRRRFGFAESQVTERLDQLSSDQLDDLGEALLDFAAPADLENWLTAQLRQ